MTCDMWHLTYDRWEEANLISHFFWNTGVGKHQGSTKFLTLLSKIPETPISHGNFSQKIIYKIPKKGIFVRETIYCNTKKLNQFPSQISLFHINKFPSQKQLSSEFLRNTLLSLKKVSKKKFLPRTKVSVKEKKLLSQKQVDRT